MKTILKVLKRTYRKVLQSIAFYPVVIAILSIFLAVIAVKLDSSEIIQTLKEKIPFLLIEDYETARSMLSTFIGGILSLTVFSFTMVMVVLNQASSNFSPRLLPGLISNKRHQLILAFYIGTLLYCTIVLISLGAYGIETSALGLSTMLAAFSSLICIGLFVYFIHSISNAIHIHNIIDGIYEHCKYYLSKELEKDQGSKVGLQLVDTEGWIILNAPKTGYFRGFDPDLMNDDLKDKNNQIEILPYLNQHIWQGSPVIKVRENLTDAEKENLIFCLTISSDRHESDKGIGGMIKLMEIAVKAMSPGINDPGTAIDAVTKLGGLLALFMQFPKLSSEPYEQENLIIIKNHVPAKELMRVLIQPIRLYAKHDSTVMYELVNALTFISKHQNLSQEDVDAVLLELKAIEDGVERNFDNEYDKKVLLKLFDK